MICIHCHQDEDAMVTYRVPLRGSVGFSLVVFEFFLTFFVLNDLTVGKALLLAVCRSPSDSSVMAVCKGVEFSFWRIVAVFFGPTSFFSVASSNTVSQKKDSVILSAVSAANVVR